MSKDSIPFRVVIEGTDTTAYSKRDKNDVVVEEERGTVEAHRDAMNARAETLGIKARYAIP